ncbi:MAG: hypothetical protein BWZ02_02320 [Lentisphaerae bacterium ADurb.BinA184]|nr:MAG: hypothetical protein BWZ02_02320 [Lentisphaerae bacterium ADurb.BinA184]
MPDNQRFRIIYHEVGHALQYMDLPVTPAQVLRKAVWPLARTQVDCLSWLIHTYLAGPYDAPRMWRDVLDPSPYEYVDAQGQGMGLFMEKVRPADGRYHNEGQRRRYGTCHELWKQGVDVVDLVGAEARRRGMAFFLAFRVNDFHHGAWEEHPRWWLEHTELSLGGGQLACGDHARRHLANLDFAHAEVREHVMAPVVAAAECYECDGIELDFSRCPPFFREGQARPDLMSAFIAELRRRLEKPFARRGRPVRLMARGLPDYAWSLSIGLDWKDWIRRGLVEHLTLGGWQQDGYHNDLTPAVEAARGTATRVYPAFDTITFDYDQTRRFGRLPYMRAACLNYYRHGAHGMYYFNSSSYWLYTYPGPVATAQPHLSEVGDPACLERKDKIYALNWACDATPRLIWDADKPDERPTVEFTFSVADAIEESRDCGEIERIELRMDFVVRTPWINELNAWHCLWGRTDDVTFCLNGLPITPQPIARDSVWASGTQSVDICRNWTRRMRFDLTAGPQPRQGVNTLTVRLAEPDPQLTGPRQLLVGLIELDVTYAKPQPHDR